MANSKTKSVETAPVEPAKRAVKASARKKEKASSEAQKTAHKEENAPVVGENVLIYATRNEGMLKALNEAAAANGITECVRLEGKVIDDYLAANVAPTPAQSEVMKMEEFVSNDNNRIGAEEDAKRLWGFLTNNEPIENCTPERKFNRPMVVKRTTLSNNGARNVLNLLFTFGFIQFTGGKNEEFYFNISDESRTATVRRQAIGMMSEAAKDFVRYRSLLFANPSLTAEQRIKEIDSLKNEFLKMLE